MLIQFVQWVNWFVLWYFILVSCVYLLLLTLSIPDILDRFKEAKIGNIIPLFRSHSFLPVTVCIPAYNEGEHIIHSVYSALKNTYPHTQVIVINDGSEDNTLDVLIEEYDLYRITPYSMRLVPTIAKVNDFFLSRKYKNLMVIDKVHSDKSDSLNVGINVTHTPIFMTLDADSLLQPDAISHSVYYMLSHANMIAAGGSIAVLNDNHYHQGEVSQINMSLKPLIVFQTAEYLRSFLFGRSGWNKMGGALCYAGACSTFMHHALVKIGGFEYKNRSQDFEIITHMHEKYRRQQQPYKVGFTPAAITWTDVPFTLKQYWHQRFNWQYYSLHSLLKHKHMLFNKQYGVVGLFSFPFYFFAEMLSGIFEFLGYFMIALTWYLGIIDFTWLGLFFGVCLGFFTFITMATAFINYITFNEYRKASDLFYILICCIIENFGFRQFGVICRAWATICYFKDYIIRKIKHNKYVSKLEFNAE